ncbi:MAG TPA: hypothetical protein ACFYDZ_01520 [Candidatus Brocadiaceae bacterium]
MLGKMKNWMNAAIIAGVVFGTMAPARAENLGLKKMVGRLSADWWEWAISAPKSVNPVGDDHGEFSVVGQHGKIWFLAGNFAGTPATRECTIPEDRSIILPILNTVCTAFFPDGSNVQELRKCAKDSIDFVTEYSASLDGKDIKVFRVQSPLFMLSIPPDSIFSGLCDNCDDPNPNPSASIADGYWVFIRHVTVGKHVLKMHGKSVFPDGSSYEQNMTYNLKIVPVGFPTDAPAVSHKGPRVLGMH